jgi:spermidine/putrescine transport system permease protein
MSSTVAVQQVPVEMRADLPPLNPPNKRLTRFILPVFTFLMIFYLTSPVFVMILFGFNNLPGATERQTPKFWGFTLDWYKNMLNVPGLTPAIKNSLIIAPTSAVVSTILGTLLGLTLGRYIFRGRGITNFVIFLAIAVPEIVLGSSLLSMFVQLERIPLIGGLLSSVLYLGFPTILASHIGFSIPFVAVTVRARVSGLDRSLEDAAQDLFANPVTAFFKVTLPLIAPGILAGFLLAFVLSLDDFVITNFVSGQVQTFPIWVYGATRIGLPPQVNVIGTLLFMAGVVAAGTNVLIQRRRA